MRGTLKLPTTEIAGSEKCSVDTGTSRHRWCQEPLCKSAFHSIYKSYKPRQLQKRYSTINVRWRFQTAVRLWNLSARSYCRVAPPI